MDRNELKALHELLTETRTEAHKAYQTALKRNVEAGDTEAAFHTLLKVNAARDKVYAALLASV